MRAVAGCEGSVQVIRGQGALSAFAAGRPSWHRKDSLAMALAAEMNWETMRSNAAAYTNMDDVRTKITEFALPGPTLREFMEPMRSS